MIIRSTFDAPKALEVLLYIARKCPDMYKALKVLYFADRLHLGRYGRFICGDRYVAMRLGPVPSGSYDLVKYARGDNAFCPGGVAVDDAFHMEGNTIVRCRDANLDYLSESDKLCLDEAIAEYGHLGIGQLKRLSHDKAYEAADESDRISLKAIVDTLPNSQELWEYLNAD